MHTKKFIWLAMLWLAAVAAHAQNTVTGTNILINQQFTTGTQFKASQTVNMQAGANLKANTSNSQHALIDPYMVFPPTSGVTGGPNAGDDGVVGSLQGQGSVGPMGNFVYTIPIQLPECLPGMTPSLSLVYNSAGGDGYLGHGWALGGMSSISRVPSNLYYDGTVDPVDFDNLDRYALDGNRLIEIQENTDEVVYGTESENMQRVYPITVDNVTPAYFKVINPNGTISYYGETTNSRVWKPNTNNIVQWLISRVEDAHGNRITYEYDHTSTGGVFTVVPSKISYNYNPNITNFATPVYNVTFTYLPDFSSAITYAAGIGYKTDKLLSLITINKGTTEIQHYEIQYSNPFLVEKHAIESIRLYEAGNVKSFNPTRFYYTNTTDVVPEITIHDALFSCYNMQNGNTKCIDDFLPGDFNGDGFTDFIRINQQQWESEFTYTTGWNLFINNCNGGFNLKTSVNNANNIVSQTGWPIFVGARIVPANLNGDNKTDLIVFYDYDNYDYVKGEYDDYTAINKYQILIADQSSSEFIPYGITNFPTSIDQRLSEFLPGDYNGDGLGDIFINSETHTGGLRNWQFCFLSQVNNNIVSLVESDAMLDVDFNKMREFRTLNFNGDSKTELSCKDYNDVENPRVITLNTTSNSFEAIHSGPSRWEYTYYGDFNGDGLTDILRFTPQPNWNYLEGYWTISFGTGVSYSFPPQPVLFDLNIKPDPLVLLSTEIRDLVYLIGDYNGDGKDDVLEQYFDYRPNSPNYNKIVSIVYFSKGDFTNPQCSKTFIDELFAVSISASDKWSHICDVDGDNVIDILTRYWDDLKVCSFKPSNNITNFPEGLLVDIIDSYANKYTTEYIPAKSSLVYNNQLSSIFLDTYSNIFSSSYPALVVKQRKALVGSTIVSNLSYSYYSGLFHRAGKGFLGYEKTLVSNNLTGLKSLSKNKLYTNNTSTYDFVTALPDYELTYATAETDYFSKTLSETSLEVLNGKRYRLTQSKQLAQTYDLNRNYFKGTTKSITDYDAYCQATSQITFVSSNNLGMSSNEDQFEHRTHIVTSYMPPIPDKGIYNRPDVVTQTAYYKKPGSSSFVSHTSGSKSNYFTSGVGSYPQPMNVLQYANAETDPMAVRKAFTYNNLGLLLTETLSAPNYVAPAGTQAPAPRVAQKIYDTQKPYLVKNSLDPKGFSSSYEYDPFELYVNETLDINGLATTVTKDILGLQTTTMAPEGTKQVSCKRWAGSNDLKPEGALYYTWAKTSGGAESYIFYNALGQELRSVGYDASGSPIYVDKTYDNLGRLLSQTAPYKRGLTSLAGITTTFTYDQFDRLVSTQSPEGTSTTQYQGLTTVVTDNQGKTYTKITDAAGWLLESKDNSDKSVKYEYNSMGKPVLTYHTADASNTSIINLYDSHGNCTKLSDPSTGIIDFQYDAFDQMVTRKGPGQTVASKYEYDVLGRMLQRVEPEGTTTFTYDPMPYGKGLIGTVSFTDHISTYTYDNYSRPYQTTQQIKGSSYTSQFGYDVYGRENKHTYATGLTVLTEFGPYGHVAKLYKGGTEPALLWKAGTTDNYGRLVQAQYGNNLVANTEFEPFRGLLTKQQAYKNGQECFRREYSWDQVGNLEWRKKIAGSTTLLESFTYDNLDRLDITTLTQNGSPTWSQDLNYNDLGNITMKLENTQDYVLNNAQYGELDQNPYAISSAQVAKTLWPQAEQVISYNTYNKMTSIQEPVDAFMLNIQYGHDHQRIYQELNENGVITAKKTFVGEGLEIVEKPQSGMVQKIHYLSGGDGNLFAMYIIDQNNVGTLYYLFTDHLGSISLITDASGNTAQELSFDAWGKRRDPATWQPYATNATIPAAFIDRGFTFHEHLYPFTLINMNGRALDPLVGRFLSADPYIQAPDNPQNLNRYSYCLNNPLRYSDPTGDIFMPIIAGAIIGAMTNATIQVLTGNVNSIGSFFGSVAIGALAGAAGVGATSGVTSLTMGGGFLEGASGACMATETSFLSGFAGGFSSGFVTGTGTALMNGENIIKSIGYGFAGGFAGGLTGGIFSGIGASLSGRSFWHGSPVTRIYEFPISKGVTDIVPYPDQIAECNDLILHDRILDKYGAKEGFLNIRSFTTKPSNGYSVTTEGLYYNPSSKGFSAGYCIRVARQISEVHISPAVISADDISFQAVVGHELIHAYHMYKFPNLPIGFKTNTERVAYQYSHNVYLANGQLGSAMGAVKHAIFNRVGNCWGPYPSEFNIPPFLFK